MKRDAEFWVNANPDSFRYSVFKSGNDILSVASYVKPNVSELLEAKSYFKQYSSRLKALAGESLKADSFGLVTSSNDGAELFSTTAGGQTFAQFTAKVIDSE